MAYDAPEPELRPKWPPPTGELVTVLLVCFLALAMLLGAGFGVWLLQG